MAGFITTRTVEGKRSGDNQRTDCRARKRPTGVAFEILNKSDRAVMAVSITCGGPSITKDGLDDEDHPTVVIEPHGVFR